jgi:hypothetical protein
MPLSPEDFMNSELTTPEENGGGYFGVLQAERTNKKDYRAAYIYINVTSYSQRQVLHNCPREFSINKIPATGAIIGGSTNLHFVFGHSVGAGIQTYLATNNRQQALFSSFIAWNADLDAEIPKKGKNSSFAFLAVEKFIIWWESEMAGEWELAHFNGKPATELTFFIDCENGYYHAGHIDAVLRHRVSGRYLVLEIKTTSIRDVDEAQYSNSEQPLGYSLVLDAIAAQLMDDAEREQDPSLQVTNSFEVLYLTYSTTRRELVHMPFTKNRSERAEWLQDLLLDHSLVGTYRRLSFFPKRGDSCWSFGGRCEYYGTCDLGLNKSATIKHIVFDRKTMDLPERVDFEFTLTDMTKAILRDGIRNGQPDKLVQS